MKKTQLNAAILALLSLGLSACNDLSTPEGVLYASWNSLKAEKVKRFKRTVRGEAREQYGNLVGMGKLLEEIQDLDFQVGEPALVRTEMDRRGRDRLRVFEVEILARPHVESGAEFPEVGTGTFMPFKTASVECDVEYVVVGGNGSVRQCYHQGPVMVCEQVPYLPPIPPMEQEQSRCWVAALRPAVY